METTEPVRKRRSVWSLFQRLPQNISNVVECFFYRYLFYFIFIYFVYFNAIKYYRLGFCIAQQPIKWILGSSLLVLLCLAGFFRFYQEKNPLKLWVPPDSDFVKDTEFLLSRFKDGQRVETIIFTADDILEPHVLYELNEITKRVMLVQTRREPILYWTDICFK